MQPGSATATSGRLGAATGAPLTDLHATEHNKHGVHDCCKVAILGHRVRIAFKLCRADQHGGVAVKRQAAVRKQSSQHKLWSVVSVITAADSQHKQKHDTYDGEDRAT